MPQSMLHALVIVLLLLTMVLATTLWLTIKKANSVKYAFGVLKQAMAEDDGYAWGWHCNLAMSAYDEGVEHKVANRAAARFMQLCFDVDTSKPPKSSTSSEQPAKSSSP